MACDAEDYGFQMLNDDEIVTSVQEESDPVGDETDENENNNESSKGPSNADSFSALETAMESGESSHQEIRKLLIGEELGDRRPSELLRVMRRRAESHSVPDDLMLELFQQHLPTRVQSILAAISPLTLEKAAEVADRVMEVTPIAVSACSVSSDKNSIESHVLEEIKKLNLRIDEISRSRSRSRNRNLPFHKRNRSKSKTYEQCWYHYKFGSAAQKCHPPCKFSKKRVRLGIMATTALPRNSRRLFIRDRRTNVTFLIDTGSDVSIIPATKTQRQNNSQMTLSAANTSPIHVYTTQTLSLDLGLRRIFQWTFLVGNVSTPIIGADFLYNFRLVPDISKQALLDSETNIKCHCILGNSRIHSIKTVSGDSVYHELLRKFPDITKPPRPDQEIKHSVVHYIETNSRPVTAKARRLAPDRLRIAKAEFENMITLGHMRPSKSNYASPLHMVPKKDSTEWRPVGDYRALNAQTIKDNYSVPNILDFTSNLHDDVHKSAIITPFGLFESTRMQFGLCNAAATFQRFIDEVLRNLPFVFAFVDDILVASSSPEEHLQHLQILFTRLQQYGLSLKPSKCIFGVTSIKFLGFKVSESGIEPLSDRVDCILNFPQPTTLTQLRRFLGLFNFYRRFVPKAAHLLAPLNKFWKELKILKSLKKVSCKNLRDSIQWTEEAEQAFNDAKNALADATLLRHPIPGAKLSLWTDASEKAVGGSLMQLCQNNWEPVAFLSVKLSKSQQKWSTYDRELLAIYISVKRFRHMLEGRDFIIYTDQKPLMYAFMQNPDKCSPRQWRHLDFISQFSTDVRHINGTHNAVADALSRIEVNQISNSFLDFEALSKAQLEDNELQSFQNDEKSSLVFKRVPSPVSATELICDTSTGSPRPFVPHNFRRTIFEHFHNLAHPGVAASFQLIASRYVWPNMRKTVKDWVQNCIACQRSKVHRHTKTPLGTFALPDARFSHIHVDLIGPLPSSEGKSFA
ncbi:transposon Tf2-6 polyprotein [Trichonephila clavipes]|nr:transposon Tf2-6 polyprotein [Trichonephila clavipes]